MLFVIKYWRVLLPIALLVVGFTAFSVWVETERQEAVEADRAKTAIETAEQVKLDEQRVYEAYITNGTINNYVERVYFDKPEETADGDRLLGTEENTEPTDGNETRVDLGGQYGLSDKESDFILTNAELLQ